MAVVNTNPNHPLPTGQIVEFLQGYADGSDKATATMPLHRLLPEGHNFIVCQHCLGEGTLLTRMTMYTKGIPSSATALAYVDCRKPCPDCRGVGMVPDDVPRFTKPSNDH